MKDRDNFTFLTSAPVHHVVLVMAVPTIISMLVTSIYNIVTTFYVGRISTQATAAVGIASRLWPSYRHRLHLRTGLGQLHIARTWRAATRQRMPHGLHGLLSCRWDRICHCPYRTDISASARAAPSSTPTILPYCETYLSFVLMAAPFMCGALCLNNQMRFQGNAAYSMFGILTGACINVVLAPILIFVFDMGITGAGISTFTGESCSMLVLLWMSRMKRNIHISHRNFTPSVAMLKEIFAGGTPSLTRQGMASISVALLNVAAGAYGDAAIAAMSIVNRIAFVIFAAMIGLGQGFQPMCGFCYGAKLYARVREGYWFIVRVGFLFMAVCAVLGFFFSEECIDVFRRDPDVVSIGTVALRWQLATLPLGAIVMYTNMMMQTIRKPWQANVLASARSGLFFIPLIIILPHFFGLLGVEMCQAWADVLSFGLAVPIAMSGFKALRDD